jgi:hypothetical protein
VHRDIKPANVLIGRNGRSRLSDLGIARVETERSQTRTGTAVGTALYMSPEQARGRPVDTRSDLFSVGLTLYEALTGNVVYDHVDSVDSSSGMDVLIYIGGLDQQKNAEFKLVFPPDPPIPRSVKRVLQKACRLRAEDRYQDAREMRDALRQALDGHLRSPEGEAVPFKWVVAGGGGLALLALVLGVWFGFLQPRMSASEDREIALQVLEETSQREQAARKVLDAVASMRPTPAPELMDAVERGIARGDVYFDDGRDNVKAGEEADDVEAYRSAVTYLRDAQPHYDEACAALNGDYLAARAEREVATAQEAVAALRADGAAEAGLAAWPQIETLLPTLAAPEGLAGCALADAQLGRVRSVAQVSVAAAAAVSELEAAWPRLAEEMRQSALRAREVAVEPAIDTDDFRMAVRQGKLELLRGDQGLAAGDYRAAHDAYRTSQQAFQQAAALREATRGAEGGTGAG